MSSDAHERLTGPPPVCLAVALRGGDREPRRRARPARASECAIVLNPLRSEAEAFRFLLYALAVIVTIVLVVVLLRALL